MSDISKTIKAILFDFDGVILDSVNVKTEAFVAMYEPYGQEVQQKVLDYHLEYGGISRYKKIEYWHKNFLGVELDETQLEALAQDFSNRVLDGVLNANFILGAGEFLDLYSNKLPFYICTGTPQKEIDVIIEKRNLKSRFVSVYGSPQSKEEMIEVIKEKGEYASTELLFIGDAMTDYRAATSKKLNFIGVRNDRTDFPVGTRLIDSIMELEEFV